VSDHLRIEPNPALAEALERAGLSGWTCPTHSGLTFAPDGGAAAPGGPCGATPELLTAEVSATMVVATDDTGREMLRQRIDPRPVHGRDAPVAYDISLTCAEGHEHYIRTEPVKKR
jgi:hypothetical protein